MQFFRCRLSLVNRPRSLALLAPVLLSVACASLAEDPLAPGVPQSWPVLNQGCDVIDGVDLCAFHGQGWKFYAYRADQADSRLLDLVDELPMNAPLRISGELIDVGDITASMLLDQVEPNPQGDPHAELRAQLQGEWLSLDDPDYVMEVLGSEVRQIYGGRFTGLEFLQLVPACQGEPGDQGPQLVLTDPEVRDGGRCFGILRATPEALELIHLARGNLLRFGRP